MACLPLPLRGALLLCLALPGPAGAAPRLDSGNSRISATVRQMNVPLEIQFRRYTAQVDLRPEQPATSSAVIEIDIGSLDLGDAELNNEALKKDWFNAAQYPTAKFVATAIRPRANGRFDVSGKLTIKGASMDANFPVTVRQENGMQVIDGVLPIKRLAFGIGEGAWRDTGMVANEVAIRFHLVGPR